MDPVHLLSLEMRCIESCGGALRVEVARCIVPVVGFIRKENSE